jgi:GT2 family glycosyltransferase
VKTSVIVLSWNGMDYLEGCLNAVLSQNYPDFEVIVVDNASTDGSADFVAERYPQVRLIRNERNLGFSAGNNVGLRAATGDVLVLLNQDTVVQTEWLSSLVKAISVNQTVGVAGSKALYPDGTIQHAGGYVNERGEGKHYGYQQEDVGQFDQLRDVDYVTGAALAITRQALESVGELDEGFTPAYYEDVDWCYRARRAGFRVVYAPRAVLVHKEASEIADASRESMYIFHRNRLRFVLKHWPLNRLVDQFVSAEQVWLESLDEGGERLIAAMHRVYLYYLLDLTGILSGRQGLVDASLDEADVVSDVLMLLRTVVPLRPARLATGAALVPLASLSPMGDAVGATESVPAEDVAADSPQGLSPTLPEPLVPASVETLGELHHRWVIREHQFTSDVPVLGPLIATFRRLWNRISTEWYVRPMIQQQIEFNALVVTTLEQLVRQNRQIIERLNLHKHNRQRLGEVLAEYVAESGREIGELAEHIRELRILIEGKTDGS